MNKEGAGGDLIREFGCGDCQIQVYAFADDAGDLRSAARLYPVKYGEKRNFDAAIADIEKWGRQAGLKSLWAPLGPSTYGDYRLKLDHLDDPPFTGEPQNSQASVDLVEQAGFKAVRLYHSHEMRLGDELTANLKAMMRFNIGLGKLSLKQVFLTKETLLAKSRQIYDITHEMFKNHFGYRAVGPENFENLVLQKVLPMVCWKTSFVLEDGNQNIVGYSLHLRDLSDEKRVLLKTFGIDPRFPQRAKAFFSLFKNIDDALKSHYERVVFCLVAAGEPTDRLARKLKPLKTSTYGLFAKDLTPATTAKVADHES